MATIREKGAARWHVQVRRKGWPPQSKTFRTKKEAEIWARDVENSMDRGIFVDRSPAERTTLREAIQIYLTEVTDKRPGEASRLAERARLERFMREEAAICAHAVAYLKPDHFEEWRDRRLTETVQRGKAGGRGQRRNIEFVPKLKKDGAARANAARPPTPPKAPKTISPGTVKRELTILKRVIDHSRRRLGLVVNPINADDVKRPVVNDERDVRLTHEQIDALLAACREARNPILAPLVEFAFELGARRSSILRIEWRDIDMASRSLLLRAVKNSRSPDKLIDQRVGLTPRAVEILKALSHEADQTRIFPLTVNALKAAFDRARARAGLQDFNFHDTRHERASSLVEAGWSDTEVMAQTGHRDPKSLKRYVNLRKAYLADRLAALPDRRSGKE